MEDDVVSSWIGHAQGGKEIELKLSMKAQILQRAMLSR